MCMQIYNKNSLPYFNSICLIFELVFLWLKNYIDKVYNKNVRIVFGQYFRLFVVSTYGCLWSVPMVVCGQYLWLFVISTWFVAFQDDDEPQDKKFKPDGGYIPRILFISKQSTYIFLIGSLCNLQVTSDLRTTYFSLVVAYYIHQH